MMINYEIKRIPKQKKIQKFTIAPLVKLKPARHGFIRIRLKHFIKFVTEGIPFHDRTILKGKLWYVECS